jgi:biopolymer transport protein ExbD
VPEAQLRQRIEDALEGKKQRIILIKADQQAPYADVMKAMDELRAVGIEDMALITDLRKTAGGE